MGNYSKKAVEVDAFRFGNDPFPDWFNGAIGDGTVSIYTRTGAQEELRRMFCTIRGQKRAECGDYIVRGVKGEIYSVEYDEFVQCYEPLPPVSASLSGASAGYGVVPKRLQPPAEERPVLEVA
jgi:hypothetical protein